MKNFTVYAIGEDQLIALMDLPGYSHASECPDRRVGGFQLSQKARKVHFSSTSRTAASAAVRKALGFIWPEHHSPRLA